MQRVRKHPHNFTFLWDKTAYSKKDSVITLNIISKNNAKIKIEDVCLIFNLLKNKSGEDTIKSRYIYDPICKIQGFDTVLDYNDTLMVTGNLLGLKMYELKSNESYLVEFKVSLNKNSFIFIAPELYYFNK